MNEFNFWIQAIISILSGIAVLVPLMVVLVKYVRKNTEEKNWTQMLTLVMNLMAEAEKLYENGAEKKEWVMGELRALADTLNYEIDWVVVSDMIDNICAVSKEVNPPIPADELAE